MCGIAGAIGVRDARALAERMACRIAHRGPDDAGVAELPRPRADAAPAGAFAHRRLSILDLSPAGHQPMTTADGRLTIVFNGEIYNFRALRASLAAEGATFRSTSDTEVVLAGWARHGRAFLARLRGMFALALWDRDAGTVTLARDPFGIKPLYLACAAGGVLFASEVRALLDTGLVPARLSGAAVATYLARGSVAEPYTLVEGITALPAGCTLELRVGDGWVDVGDPRPFHDPAAERVPHEDAAGAARRIREVLRDSVRHHLVSDVPVALFLSGGIDSSAMVALTAEVTGAAPETFTVVFGEREFSEAGPARIVAERFGARHHEIPLAGTDLLAALPDAFAAMDQPSMDGLNTYVVSRAVRARGIKVVLSGLGGDEMFAGYPSFARARAAARVHRVPAVVRRALAGALARGRGVRAGKTALLLDGRSPAEAAYVASRTLFPPRDRQALLADAAVVAAPLPSLDAPAWLSPLGEVSWYELTGYMRDTLLRDSDVFSMAHSLELRVPFVDVEVARVALGIADDARLRAGRSKPLLVDALADLLPREVWDRPKQGFTLPFEAWMRGALRADIERELTVEGIERVGLAPREVMARWRAFLDGRLTWSRAWALYTLVRWAREHDAAPAPDWAVDATPAPAVALAG